MRPSRNLKPAWFYPPKLVVNLLSPHEAVDDEVDRDVEDEEEVLDGGETEHPAGVGGKHAQGPAEIGSFADAGLQIFFLIL